MDLLSDNDQTVIDPNKDYFEDLVGEGKKYKTQQDAGRAIIEKDAFIERLLHEKRQLESDLQTRSNQDDFMDRLKSVVQPQATPAPVTPPVPSAPSPTVDPKDLETLIQRTINEQREREAREANVREVQGKLQQALGPNYQQTLRQRAHELSIPLEWLNDAAARSPQAFYRMLGLDSQAPSPQAIPQSQVNPAAFGQNKTVKNWDYYNNMRKSDPTRYHSKEIQKEIWESAKALGDSFTN